MRVSGRLVDAAGQPAKATVHVMPSPPSHLRRLHDLGVAVMEETGTSFETAHDGSFEAEVPPGVYRLDAVTSSGLRVRADLGVLTEKLTLADIPLPGATELSVRVVDADGQPIEDALVLVDTEQWVRERGDAPREQPGVGFARWHGRTDDKGRVAAPALREADHFVRVAAFGFLPHSVPSNGRGVVTVELERGTPQPVQVTDERGRPVPRAVVRFGESLVPVALTDDEGKATVTASLEQALDYQVESADLGSGSFTAPPGGSEEPRKVALEPPVVLFGKVIDRATGDPLPGALVWSRDRPSDFATTGAEGRYELPTWTASQRIRLGVAALGFNTELMRLNNTRVEAPTAALEPSHSVVLLVQDERGEAVADAAVTAWPADRSRRGGWPRARRTGNDGRVTLVGLRAVGYVLQVLHPGYATSEEAVTIDVPSNEPLTVTLADGIAGWGTIVDVEDRPIAGAEVWLDPEDSRSSIVRSSPVIRLPRKVVTDAEGHFDAPPVRGGRYVLRAEADGFAPAVVAGLQLEVDGQEIGTLRLDPAVELTGRVVDETGAPIQGVELVVTFQNRSAGRFADNMRTAESSEDGSFRVDRLGVGSYRITTRTTSSTRLEAIEVELPLDEPLEIVLDGRRMLRGTVVGAEGQGLASVVSLFSVDRSNSDDSSRRHLAWGQSDADGRFQIGPGKAGLHVLQIEAPGHVQRSIDVEIGQDGTQPLEIRLERGAVLSGSVRSEGQPVTGAWISATRAGDGTHSQGLSPFNASATSDGSGRYVLEGVAAGQIELRVRAEGHRETVETVDVGADATLDFELTRGLEITGRVVDESGEPVDATVITLLTSTDRSSWGTENRQAWSDSQGRFKFGGLGPGWARLQAAKRGYAIPRLPEVELREGRPSDVNIVLEQGFTVSGTVLGVNEASLSEIRIQMTSLDGALNFGAFPETRPGYRGDFALENVGPGAWRVFAHSRNYERRVARDIVIDGDLSGVELDFDSGLTLRGTVTVNGQPATEGLAIANSLDESSGARSELDPAGAFKLEGVQPGNVRLHVLIMDSALRHLENLDLQADTDLTIELTTVPLNVIVLGPDGAGVPAAMVSLLRTHSDQRTVGETAEDGTLAAQIQGDSEEAGYAWVEARHPDYGAKRVPYSGQSSLEIRLGTQETLTVTLLASDGLPPPPASLWLEGESLTRARGESGPTIEMTSAPGGHLLWVTAGAEVAGPVEVDVPGEVTVPLQLGGWARMKVLEADFGAVVVARRGDHQHPEQFYTDSRGAQPIGPLTPGPWTFEILSYPNREALGAVEVQIFPGETIDVDVP